VRKRGSVNAQLEKFHFKKGEEEGGEKASLPSRDIARSKEARRHRHFGE